MERFHKRIAVALTFFIAFLPIQSAHGVAPSTPSITSVTASTTAAYGAGTITVVWGAVSNATSYSAMLTKKDSQETPTVITTRDATQLEATFRNLSGGTTYIVQVKAWTGVESSAWSSNTRYETPKTFPKSPAKPTIEFGPTLGTGWPGKAKVTWTALSTAESGGYDVTSYKVTEINSSKEEVVDGTTTTKTFTGLTLGSTIEFTVTAITAAGATGATSDKSTSETLADVPSTPDKPTLSTTTTSGEVKADWKAPTSTNSSNLTKYTVQLIKDGVDFLTKEIDKIADAFWTFTGLLPAKYTAKVNATNGVGDSAWSALSNEVTIAASASAAPSSSASSSSSASPSPSASLSASPSPSPSPSATPTETAAPSAPATSAPIGGGGGGFFGGGGGALPLAVVPLVSPSPTPSPTLSPSPTPTPSATPSASSTPTKSSAPTATPSVGASKSPTASAQPTPTKSTGASPAPVVTKLPVIAPNTYFTPVQATAKTRQVDLTATKSTQTIKANGSISVSLPKLKQGTAVSIMMRTPKGEIISIQSSKTTKAGTFKLPTLQFKKSGNYTLFIKVGTTTKSVAVNVTK